MADRAAVSRNSPPPVDARGTAVDGLTVGDRLMAAGEYELALKAYLRAASEHGADPAVLAAIGSANLRLGRLGQAELILRRAVEADPSSVSALNNLGVVLLESGRAGEARRVFEQAYALDSGQTDSVRENLRLAIAKSAGLMDLDVYPEGEPTGALSTVRLSEGPPLDRMDP